MVKYIPKLTGIQGVFNHKFSCTGVLVLAKLQDKKRTPQRVFFVSHPLGESPSSRKHPVCSFQAAYALPGTSLYRLFI